MFTKIRLNILNQEKIRIYTALAYGWHAQSVVGILNVECASTTVKVAESGITLIALIRSNIINDKNFKYGNNRYGN